MSDAKVKLIIEAATEEAKRKVAGFAEATDRGLQKAEKSARSFGDGMKAGWQKAKAAWVEIAAGVIALKKAFNLANQAARFKERETAFANMAASHGVAADKIVADLKRISRGTIDTMTLMEKAGTAMLLGIQAEKLAKLMEIARASSKITGQTVSQAFSDISLAVGRQSRMILDNLGIIVKVEDANKQYAAQLGKVAGELTEAERKQAFLNATLEAGGDIVKRTGAMQESAAEKIQRMQARWKDELVTLGKAVLTFSQGLQLTFTGVGLAINKMVQKAAEGIAWLLNGLAKIPGAGAHIKRWADNMKAVGDNSRVAAEKGVKYMSEKWDEMQAVWQKSEPIRRKVTKDLQDQAKAARKTGDEIKRLSDLQKTDAETRAAATEAMYKEAGIDAEGYYREEINKLTQRAKTWQDAGVDVENINQYMYDRIEEMEAEAFGKGAERAAGWLGQMKYHTQSMISDLTIKQTEMSARLAQMSAGIKGLDNSEIGITVKLYDDAFISGIDNLIYKLEHLRSAQTNAAQASEARASAARSQADGDPDWVQNIENEIAEDIKYGRSSITQPSLGWVLTKDELTDLNMGY